MLNAATPYMPHFTVLKKSPRSSRTSQIWPAEAQGLLTDSRYEADLYSLRQAAVEVPSAENYVSQAVCLIHLARPLEALQACDRAIGFDSNNPRAWLFRGVACHRLGRWQEAYTCYDLATGLAPRKQVGCSQVQPLVGLGVLKSFVKGAFNSRLTRLRVH